MAMQSGFIKRIRDIMRMDAGINGDAQRIEQMVWMLFLKVYDAKEDDWELNEDNYESIIPEDLRWRNWAKADSNGHAMTGDKLLNFVNNTLFPVLKGNDVKEGDTIIYEGIKVTPDTPIKKAIVKSTFEDANNYMKDGVYLRQVIDVIDEIEFDDVKESHAFGFVYEEILRELQSAGSSGEFYTPRAVTEFMALMIKPKLGEKMADFACGTGGFITSWLGQLSKQVTDTSAQKQLDDSIYGIEKKPFPYLLCVTNMLLHDIEVPNMYNKYLFYYLMSMRKTYIGMAEGGAQPNISKEKIVNSLIPLPPAEEQKRIVAKIEELLPYVDRYAAAYEKLEQFNAKFPEDMKKSILQYAIQGKLVEQRPEEGTGEELYRQIQKEKQLLIKEGKLKKTRALPTIMDEEVPYDFPASWKVCYIDDIAFVTKLAGFEYTKYIADNLVPTGIPLFKGKNVQNGKLVLSFESYIPENVSDELPRSQITKKCLLTPYVGTIGNIAVFDGSFKAHLGSNVGKIELLNPDTQTFILEEYVLWYLKSTYGYAAPYRCQTGRNPAAV